MDSSRYDSGFIRLLSLLSRLILPWQIGMAVLLDCFLTARSEKAKDEQVVQLPDHTLLTNVSTRPFN